MSKTLTEQWREGKLPQGYYYIVANTEQKHNVVFYLPERNTEDESRLDLKDGYVLEVLAPVPNYNEFVSSKKLEFVADAIISGEKIEWENIVKRGNRKEMAKWINERKNKTVDGLQKQLEIATKALNDIVKDYDRNGPCEEDCVGYYMCHIAIKALKEMEG